ncbi:GNAT family N-acetyltransferase [Dyella caseinilytica]|uniref:GNAT family N-acetyltransferase n=1 Tax=Dyella caseinilytica TaxID=1849581 RepID=A0ABX7GY62_9GAMM|nr:GNAT family N-acetyltransferase [Dyella caseinilytica]QRN55432.1 GNAT family N-acetyltransferase [Dyella caseinilytica]GGA01653.1 GNAT family acetyltransferase [Dyella caseinilytica]
MKLRKAGIDDAPEIARLAEELGYPVSPEAMWARLAALLSHPDHHISVVEDDDALHGWIAVEHRRTLESGDRMEIVGLVVDASRRGSGVGRMLVADAEQWARQCGFHVISVRSNIVREASHPFYEHLGYARRKTQHYYVKPLASA